MTDTEQIVPAAEEIQGAPVEETAAPAVEGTVEAPTEAPAEEVAPQA
ncbi:MAG TPA: hypothetical protein VGE62_00835 [Candidatus Paceibacterota bacterium]